MNVATSPAVTAMIRLCCDPRIVTRHVVATEVVLPEGMLAEGEAIAIEPRDHVERRRPAVDHRRRPRDGLYFQRLSPTKDDEYHDEAERSG